MPIDARTFIAATLFCVAPAAHAHAKVLESSPRNGETVAAAPPEVRLKFSEAVEINFTTIKLVGPDGKDVPVAKPKAAAEDDSKVVLPLPALPSGAYTAQWSTVGHDGHRTKGELAFTVK